MAKRWASSSGCAKGRFNRMAATIRGRCYEFLVERAASDPERRRQLCCLIEMASADEGSRPMSRHGFPLGGVIRQIGLVFDPPLAWPAEFDNWVATQELAPSTLDFAPTAKKWSPQEWFLWAREVAYGWRRTVAAPTRDVVRIRVAKRILARCFEDEAVLKAVGETNRNALADLVIGDWQSLRASR